MTWVKGGLAVLLVLITGLWLNNSSHLAPHSDGSPKLLAHRGVHQIYVGTDRSNDACHASTIAPVTHEFVENTIPSMRAAFEYGADVVELDIHLAPDGVFAVFHDWTLDCRTNGSGVTEDQPFDELNTLDLAHNLSVDGKTYPLRGKFVGKMPSLTQVLEADLPGQFLINFKSRRRDEGEALAALMDNPDFKTQVFGVYGGDVPTHVAIAAIPGLRGYSKSSLLACLKPYVALGWTGHVPKPCRNTMITIPSDIAPYLWGWPHRFTERMRRVGTEIILLGPYDGSGFSTGLDSASDLEQIPDGFDGYVWTNRIDLIGPLLSN